MIRVLPVGRSVSVEVPATSANLGPGFDSLGLALDWYDRSKITVIDSGIEIDVTGEGADTVPVDESHLVIATVLEALSDWGIRASGLRLEANNTIPHGRGLGSSSAALVGGLLMAWGLAYPGVPVDRTWLLREASAREGHADNVAPAIFGGFVLTWSGDSEDSLDAGLRSRCSRIDPRVAAVALVPQHEVLTTAARSVLPAKVPFAAAVANASRAALLVHAMAEEPSLLLEATSDRLHQEERGKLMPASLNLVHKLRELGFGALISGAGPTVLALVAEEQIPALSDAAREREWARNFDVHALRPGNSARILTV